MTFLLVLVALSTYRLTRLVTADRLTQRFRQWAIAKGEMIGYLATCDWCLSIWVAPIPSVVAVLAPSNRLVLAGMIALSASALTGLIATIESRIDR